MVSWGSPGVRRHRVEIVLVLRHVCGDSSPRQQETSALQIEQRMTTWLSLLRPVFHSNKLRGCKEEKGRAVVLVQYPNVSSSS